MIKFEITKIVGQCFGDGGPIFAQGHRRAFDAIDDAVFFHLDAAADETFFKAMQVFVPDAGFGVEFGMKDFQILFRYNLLHLRVFDLE